MTALPYPASAREGEHTRFSSLPSRSLSAACSPRSGDVDSSGRPPPVPVVRGSLRSARKRKGQRQLPNHRRGGAALVERRGVLAQASVAAALSESLVRRKSPC